ncbi:MAG: hypothetical protein RL701_8179 [Pseudomonadota bacterium]|jgi:hypothetical protein
MEQIHGRLSDSFCGVIDALIIVPDAVPRSQLELLRESAPEPTPDAINRFLRAATSLRDMDLGTVDLDGLPGVTASTVTHYAELVQRYDASHLRRFAVPKARAMLACFLVEREKSLLDDLVTMHHAYLTGFERRSRNTSHRLRRVEHRHKAECT